VKTVVLSVVTTNRCSGKEELWLGKRIGKGDGEKESKSCFFSRRYDRNRQLDSFEADGGRAGISIGCVPRFSVN
jgi:hypothetical protein